jgi:hypothetical protein
MDRDRVCPSTVRDWQQVVAGKRSAIFVSERLDRTPGHHTCDDRDAQQSRIEKKLRSSIGYHPEALRAPRVGANPTTLRYWGVRPLFHLVQAATETK